jgi:hypothetical protein
VAKSVETVPGRTSAGQDDRHVQVGVRRSEVHAQVGGQRVECRLRRVVGGPDAGERHPAEERGDVDEVALAALEKVRHDRLHSVERGLHVDGHHLVEIVVAQLEHALADAAAGVVDPDIDLPVRLDRLDAQPFDVGAHGDVGDDRGGLTAGGGDFLQRVFAAGGEHQLVAFRAELFGEGGADA